MKPQLQRIGNSQSPVVIVDEFSGSAEAVARLADELAPFPLIEGNYYPGVRRVVTESDQAAYEYVFATCRGAAPFIGGAFEVNGFDLIEGSFSVVSMQPNELQAVQRAPHFDSTEQSLFAGLHYLRVPPNTGTAFFRHRATGIERITDANLDVYVSAARAESAQLPADSGYIAGSNEFYEQIAFVEAIPDRLVLYHGSLLHSGIIPEGMPLSADPREGRLTANFFLRGR